MTPLRQRMLDDLQLRGFSPRTQEAYIRAVCQLATHFHRPPDQLAEDELREYFLYLTKVKHFARASFTIALCGIKFFYERTRSREWKVFDLVRPAREKKLPAILSRDEVRRILGGVRLSVYRACLTTIYVCGLRLQEGTQVQVADVDSGRGLLHVHGTGVLCCQERAPDDACEEVVRRRAKRRRGPAPVPSDTGIMVVMQVIRAPIAALTGGDHPSGRQRAGSKSCTSGAAASQDGVGGTITTDCLHPAQTVPSRPSKRCRADPGPSRSTRRELAVAAAEQRK
jgi:integrase